MITIDCISDTHLHSLPAILVGRKADILIHAGDALNSGSWGDWNIFLKDLEMIRDQYKFICYIPGNHDKIVEKNQSDCKRQLKSIGVDLLIDERIYYGPYDGGIDIYGTPWVPHINGIWGFESQFPDSEFDIGERFKNIPDFQSSKKDPKTSTHILVSHGPCFQIMDGKSWGSKTLLDEVLKKRPQYFISGHIHSGYGQKEFNGIKFYNVATCQENYLPLNPVTRIEI
jgi:DNA repair exonuclease SbcCD nuclease subunit